MAKNYLLRDVSWLHFNERVLQEAADKRNALYERIQFLAIYSSNLDEFFRVRVPAVRSARKYSKKTGDKLMTKPGRTLREIRTITEKQQARFGRIFKDEILPELESHGIYLMPAESFDSAQRAFAINYFNEHIRPDLEVIHADAKKLFLENKALYFVIDWKADEPYNFVKIPTQRFDRFIELPAKNGKHTLTFIDDIVRYGIPEHFDHYIDGMYEVKLSRDADLGIEDEFAGDLIAKIKAALPERDQGLPTRFLYDASMPKEMLEHLKNRLHLSRSEMIPGARYHNFNDFFKFPDPTDNPELHKSPMPPLPHAAFDKASSITAAIQQKDRVLHFPYQNVDYLMKWLSEVSEDPAVKNLKITLYRVADDSAVCTQLLEALKNGKQVTVFVEAKARFDEASNLNWGSRLQKAGATVIYSKPGIKVHTKLLLVQRQESGSLRNYAYVGTGNFNEKTARLYCDHALLTADARITDEVFQVFELLENGTDYPFKHLLVAPKYLKDRFIALVDREIELAKAGKVAYIILKMNSLENEKMIDKIYEASQAGVQVQLIVRGICCILPDHPEHGKNIRAHSIVDRFLEHARVYIFGNDGDEKMYIASADWMTRNLKRRVEVAAPIYDAEVYEQIRHIVNLQLGDNTKARYLSLDKLNMYKKPAQGEEAVRAQYNTYAYLSVLAYD